MLQNTPHPGGRPPGRGPHRQGERPPVARPQTRPVPVTLVRADHEPVPTALLSTLQRRHPELPLSHVQAVRAGSKREVVALLGGNAQAADTAAYTVVLFGRGGAPGSGTRFRRVVGEAAAQLLVKQWAEQAIRVPVHLTR